MKNIVSLQDCSADEVASQICAGRVIVIPTDTIYGFSCQYANEAAVQRVRDLKQRPDSPFIVLVATIHQAESLVRIDERQRSVLNQNWPGPFSFILEGEGETTLAIRLPDHPWLQSIIEKTGPIVSTSCNPSGETAATDIEQCARYFGDAVELYVDGGVREVSTPSALVNLCRNPPIVIRPGPKELAS